MKEYSLADAMHLLAITNRQLDRLLAIAGIDKQSLADASNKDKRRKLLTQEQFDSLAALHSTPIPVIGDATLAARVAALEDEVRQLKAMLKVQSISHAARPHATAIVERRIYTSIGDTLPVDWFPLHSWASAHGLASTTLKSAIKDGRIPGQRAEDTPWQRGRTKIAWAIAPEDRATIFAVYRPQQKCGDETCPCSTI